MFAMDTVWSAHTLVYFNRQAQATGPRRSKRKRGHEGSAGELDASRLALVAPRSADSDDRKKIQYNNGSWVRKVMR